MPRRFKIAPSRGGWGWSIEWYPSIDSTMVRASELAADGAPTGTVVVADYQSHGRGTRGRTWLAPPGTCLMFSLVLRPGMPPSQLADLPARIAGRIRDLLVERYDLDVDVKHPNDLMIDGKKLAGILCQSHIRAERVEWVVCGIGLNTNLEPWRISVPGSTSMRIAAGEKIRHEPLLLELLGTLAIFQEDGIDADILAGAET